MQQALITVAVLVVGMAIAVFVGTRMVRNSDGGSAGVGNAFGGLDVFDPAKGRAKEDLDSEKHQLVVTPSSDDDQRRTVRVDTDANTVRIKRPSPPQV